MKIKIPFLPLLPLILSLSLTQMLAADIQTNDPLKHIQTYAGIEEYELTSNGLKILKLNRKRTEPAREGVDEFIRSDFKTNRWRRKPPEMISDDCNA